MDNKTRDVETCFREFVQDVQTDMILFLDGPKGDGFEDELPTDAEWQVYYNEFLAFCRKWGQLMADVGEGIRTVTIKENHEL